MSDTSAIKINVDGEEINKAIAKAIMESQLGSSITVFIKRYVTDYQVRSQFETIAQNIIREEIHKIVTNDYRDRIINQIKIELNDEKIAILASRIVDKILEQRY